MKTGDRVKLSPHSLRTSREWWLSQGSYERKSSAKAEYDRQAARRGTLITPAQLRHRPMAEAVAKVDRDDVLCVAWDDGTESTCLSYCVVLA